MPEFRYISLDLYPIVELNVEVDVDPAIRIEETQAEFEHFFRNDVPYALLLDGQQSASDGSAERRKWVEWMERERDALTRLNRGVAMYHPNVFMRGMMTAFTWWFTPPYTLTYQSSREEALLWLQDRTRDLEGTKPKFN